MTSRFPPFAFVELVSRVAFVVKNKSMVSRFASISDEEVKEFTEKLENENTKKKTRGRIFSVCYKAQPYL